MEQQTYIKGQDHRAIIVDNDGNDVVLSTHVSGGHATIYLSHDAARELINALRCIVGDDHA